MFDRVASSDASPSDHARESEMTGLLETTISRLSPRHRPVFLMARYEDMSYDEISRTLGIPVGTVKSRMNKAVKFLMSELKEAGV